MFWTVLNSFKEEQDANTSPKLLFDPTLARYSEVTETTPGLLSFREAFMNSATIVIISTVIVLALAIPAAYALAVKPIEKWRDVLLFFISTKFLPVVASILPLWIIAREFDLLNTRLVLVILYTAMNLPLAVWMLRSFFQEIPRELIEAAEIDGAGSARATVDGDPADRRPRDRRHCPVVCHLCVERVLLRRAAQSCRSVHDADLGDDEHQHAW